MRVERCWIGGNVPHEEKVKRVLAQSGFYTYFTVKPGLYDAQANTGILTKRKGKRVEEKTCSELIHFATRRVHGTARKNGGLYRALIECMANTRDHAHVGPTNNEPWWVAAYFDEDTGIASFAFLDNGVGVFKSARLRSAMEILQRHFSILSHSDILLDVFDNQLASRTGLPYRGKGLPAIKRALDRGQIRNLRVISNAAHLDVGLRKGRSLRYSFRGTCLCWEIHQ